MASLHGVITWSHPMEGGYSVWPKYHLDAISADYSYGVGGARCDDERYAGGIDVGGVSSRYAARLCGCGAVARVGPGRRYVGVARMTFCSGVGDALPHS